MAKFQKGKSGNPRGRPRGARNKLPLTVRASIKAICQDINTDDPALIRAAFEKGLKSKPPQSFQYLQLWAHYTSGKPPDTLKVDGELRMPTIVNHFSAERTEQS